MDAKAERANYSISFASLDDNTLAESIAIHCIISNHSKKAATALYTLE
jgi:hypothetical protein